MSTQRITSKRKLTVWMLVGVLIALLLIAAPVFAEGETPAEVPTQDAQVLPTEVSVEEAPPEAPAPEGEAPPEETAAEPPAEMPAEETEPAAEVPAEAETPAEGEAPAEPEAEILAAEPEVDAVVDEVIIADADGVPLVMASQDSAEILSSGGDPWWKVGTTLYATVRIGFPCPSGTTEGVTCWKSNTPITEALDRIAAGLLPSDRKLYVEADTLDYVETVWFDATTYPLLAQMNGLIGAGSGGTTIDGNVYIDDNINGFTLSGFTIKGIVGVWNSAGTLILNDLDITSPTTDGIMVVNHNGTVEVRNTNSSGNYGGGAYINNQAGTGSVKVLNSSFDDNGNTDGDVGEAGLSIQTSRVITLEGVSASRNLGRGIEMWNFSALTIKHTLANYNEDPYSGDIYYGGAGILAMTNKIAPVTLENIQANYNANDGIYVSTLGVVKAKHIEAQYNTIRLGAFIYDDFNPEYITDIRRVSEFLSDDIDYDEWRFEGTNGQFVDIILETSQWANGFDPLVRLYDSSHTLMLEDDNTYDGYWNAQIQTTLPADGYYYIRVYRAAGTDSSTYDLSLNYDDNYAHSYWIGANGFEYSDWAGFGTFKLENGFFNQNGDDGLYVNNRNTVFISSIVSTNNGGCGVVVDKTGGNWDCSGGPCVFLGNFAKGTVTITSPKATGWLTANTFSGNGQAGVNIRSKGNITVSNFDAFENGWEGLSLDNCLRDWDTGVCMGAGTVTVNVPITNWYNWVGDNSSTGIQINSTGNVKIEKTSAGSNSGDGINVDTKGTIKLANVTANENDGYGAYLNTLSAPAARTVTIVDSIFNENTNTGLKVLTAGLINLQGSSASDNKSPTWGSLESLPISLYDQIYDGDSMESFNFYGTAGQYVDIILESADFDAYLQLLDGMGNPITADDNSYGGTDAQIIYTLPSDDWYQIFVSYAGVDEYGAYVLSVNDAAHAYASWPGSGAELDNTAGTAGVTITATKANPYTYFDDNANLGLWINTNGVVSITGASANRNYRVGTWIETLKNVTVQDTSKTPISSFDDNGWTGVYVLTLGNIKLNGVSASGNGGSGVDLDNCQWDNGLDVCIGTSSILIGTKKNFEAAFDGNGFFGISAYAKGTIKLTNISAQNNGFDGAALYSYAGGVTVNTSGSTVINNFSGNGWNLNNPLNLLALYNGLTVYTTGAINAANIISNGNGNRGGGILLVNSLTPSPGPVSLTNAICNENDWYGIYIKSLSNITLKNVEASGNADTGAYLFNQYEGYAGNVSIKYTKGSTNRFDNNNGKGLEILTNGTVTMGNIHAEGNFLTSGVLFGSDMGVGPNVHEYYNDVAGPDKWWFYADVGTYDLYLSPSSATFADLDPFGFDPYLELYNDMDTFLAGDDNSGGGLSAYFPYTFTTEGWYYLEVSSSVSGESGFYHLEVNNYPGDPAYIWNNGVAVYAGKNVTVSGSQRSEINYNSIAGLSVFTPGNITIKWMSAIGNGCEGMYLDTRGGLGNVSVSGLNASSYTTTIGNGWDGMLIYTNGKTTLSNLWALNNGMDGIQVGDDSNPTGNTVTLNNLNLLKDNTLNGLRADTLGLIIAKKVSAFGNGEDGMVLNNTYGIAPIIVTGDSFFKNNGGNGLSTYSTGHITISKVTAEHNGGNGIEAESDAGNITIYNVFAMYSGDNGLKLTGNMKITLTSVVAFSNGFGTDGDGLQIIGTPTTLVTLKYSAFMGNEGNGIDISGVVLPVVLYNTYYFGNDVSGGADLNYYLH